MNQIWEIFFSVKWDPQGIKLEFFANAMLALTGLKQNPEVGPVHKGENVSDGSRVECRLPGDGALAAVGQRGAHHGQGLAVQLQWASLETKASVVAQW